MRFDSLMEKAFVSGGYYTRKYHYIVVVSPRWRVLKRCRLDGSGAYETVYTVPRSRAAAAYPGCDQVEAEKRRAEKAARASADFVPDSFGVVPNYDAFPGWDAERVLCWLNVD